MMTRCVFAAAVAFAAVCSPAAVSDGLDPIVPIKYKVGEPAKMIEALRTLRKDFGLRRFVFTAPGVYRLFNRADREMHVKIGESMVAARKALSDTDIEIGWWDYPTFSWCGHEKGQHIMDCDGHLSDAMCPLDDTANAPFLENLKTAARIGHPSIYFIEDDFTLSNHAGLNEMRGCFCPLHLADYARRVGKAHSAKEIAGFFRNPTPENEPMRRAFAETARDSLVRLAKRIRAAIDEVDPSVRVCICQSGCADLDGDTTAADAYALAGKTRPLARIYGAGYFCQNAPTDLPVTLAHTFYSAQNLPKDIELVYEGDPFPHTRFYNSSLFFTSELAAALMAGVNDFYLYCTQYTDAPLADTAYAAAFRDNRRRFDAVRDFRRRSSLVGVRAVYDAEEKYLYRGGDTLCESFRILSKFGFPITTRPSKASILVGDTARRFSEGKLREIFSGAVIVDAPAAKILVERGLGPWLGCEVKPGKDLSFAWERTLPVEGSRDNGIDPYHRRVPKPPLLGWSEPDDYIRIAPGKDSETMARFEDVDNREVAPSFVSSPNALGGRVGVLAFPAVGNIREWLYSPRKQDMFRNFFDRAGALPDVVATRTPGTWLEAAVSDDGREMLVMVNNLAGEPRDDISLEFAGPWRGGRVERLQADGTWKGVGTASGEFRPSDGYVFAAMVPEFFRVVR